MPVSAGASRSMNASNFRNASNSSDASKKIKINHNQIVRMSKFAWMQVFAGPATA